MSIAGSSAFEGKAGDACAGRAAGAEQAQGPFLDVVALGLEADAVELVEELHQLGVLVLHRTDGLEESVDHVVDRAMWFT